ncbi:MAG: hypothetical protein E7Z73_09170 [Methanobrevibacter millerae]|uniref:Uncharacterized protein n=1 Tax=Methanobrevibacter millerae TaxID=230361 RepID=A0A8T3VKY6_9EURY|nr:hypothetical protein [Methanobrevibacter millerae]MBE6505883.1 hypothetical protein [Methanobrevibacter millerae]
MRRQDKLRSLLLILLILFIAANINGINSFLSVQTDRTIDFGHSVTVVPQAWNTTEELNLTNQSKTPHAITNEYVYIDHWDDWPEDHITSVSDGKFASMEDGGFKVLRMENKTMSGVPVSKEYFTNPSRDNNVTWSHVGVNYVFPKEDTNYAIQVHYFTSHDYNNTTFLKEVDDRIEDDMSNIHNNQYNGFISGVRDVFNFITGAFNQK